MLSKSVADSFNFLRKVEGDVTGTTSDTTETENFCRMFDRFFDMLNSRNMLEGRKKLKPDILPYYSGTDKRFKESL